LPFAAPGVKRFCSAIAIASQWQASTLLRMAPLVAAWILGDHLRTRRAHLRAVEDRAAQLELEHELMFGWMWATTLSVPCCRSQPTRARAAFDARS